MQLQVSLHSIDDDRRPSPTVQKSSVLALRQTALAVAEHSDSHACHTCSVPHVQSHIFSGV